MLSVPSLPKKRQYLGFSHVVWVANSVGGPEVEVANQSMKEDVEESPH